MGALPDEIWREILRLGVTNSNPNSRLTYKDLCCISISSKQFNLLSTDDHLWSLLLTLDFPKSPSQPLPLPLKTLYRSKFEREKERQLAAHRRAVLRIESQIAVRVSKLKELRRQLVKEKERLQAAVEELRNLERARSAAVALNVWQPEVVRGKHKRVVEQCVVPAGTRVVGLEMEVKVCRQQIEVLEKGCRQERERLDAAKRDLELINYHPLRPHHCPLPETSAVAAGRNNIGKPKKMKHCSD